MTPWISASLIVATVCIAAALAPEGRRILIVALTVLLCAAALAGFAAIELLPMVSRWMDLALVASALVALLIPVYLLVRPPEFGDEDEDDSGGGGTSPPPTRPEPPAPDPQLPELDWSSFDDARREWEREPVST